MRRPLSTPHACSLARPIACALFLSYIYYMYIYYVYWPIQEIVLFRGFYARINTILCAPTLYLGTPPHPVISRTIAQHNVSPRPPVIAIYTTQYWQLQYRVKANMYIALSRHRTPALERGLYHALHICHVSIIGVYSMHIALSRHHTPAL